MWRFSSFVPVHRLSSLSLLLFSNAELLRAVQICSAVQNQDFTVIQDYLTGLKALLYLQSRSDLAGWDGQSAPTPRNYLGKPVLNIESIIGKVRVL
jgi:hypothetical protein